MEQFHKMNQPKSALTCSLCRESIDDCKCSKTLAFFHVIRAMTRTVPQSYDILIITKYLEKGDININIPLFFNDRDNKPPLILSIFTYLCIHGTKEVLNLFIQYGADINNMINNVLPIQLAVSKLNRGTIEALIDAGIDIFRMQSAIHYAIKYSSYDCTKLFLEKGLSSNYIGKNEFSILYYAVKNKFETGVSLLLDYGAKVDESVMQLVETDFDNDIIKKLITNAVQVQSRKRLREPSSEINQPINIAELFANAPLLTEEDKDVIIKFFTTPCVCPRITPQRRMKLNEINTPSGREESFLILYYKDMVYLTTKRFKKTKK